jgi:hypothetical protein
MSVTIIQVSQNVLNANQEIAERNRAALDAWEHMN